MRARNKTYTKVITRVPKKMKHRNDYRVYLGHECDRRSLTIDSFAQWCDDLGYDWYARKTMSNEDYLFLWAEYATFSETERKVQEDLNSKND